MGPRGIGRAEFQITGARCFTAGVLFDVLHGSLLKGGFSFVCPNGYFLHVPKDSKERRR